MTRYCAGMRIQKTRRAVEEYGCVAANDVHPRYRVKATGSYNICAKVMVAMSIFSFIIVP
jgi:hypothetical protein